jgi:hypothetical protein
MNKWLQRLKAYWKDKLFSEKCGLAIYDLCVHEFEEIDHLCWLTQIKCKKCGKFIKYNQKELDNDND